MVRADFDRDLKILRDEMLMLGVMVEKSISLALQSLQSRDLKLAEEVVNGDDYIDSK